MTKKKNLTFSVTKQAGTARCGLLRIGDITVETPVFMPVGTQATVKAISAEELVELGYKLILGNAYHLSLRPGDHIINELGGLAKFMNWPGLVLTDSGGFQAFSLQELRDFSEQGFKFKNHLDGSEIFLTPERSIAIQVNLRADIAMCLDVCPSLPASYEDIKKSVSVTTDWAKRCYEAAAGRLNLFGIVQGAGFDDLRESSYQQLSSIPFSGFAIGGVSVGESKHEVRRVLQNTAMILPAEKPRYAMGIGDPVTVLHAVEHGIDMFDCVLPTRNARNGSLLTKKGYLTIKKAEYKCDPAPIEEDCKCLTCLKYSRAYLRHLHQANEILASVLSTRHNLWFMQQLLNNARQAIKTQQFTSFKERFLRTFMAAK